MTPALALYLAVSPEIHAADVAMLEHNVVMQSGGEVRFQQVIFWQLCEDDHGRMEVVDAGWRIVKDGQPCVHPYGDKFRVVWWCGERVYVVTSDCFVRTVTTYDREARFRERGGWYRPLFR